jgi:hypothetical protein
MAMPKISSSQLGDLSLLMYDFEKPGDVLPMHNHTEATAHVIFVTRGTVLILVLNPDNSVDSHLAEAGEVVDTFAGFPHSVVGIAANSRTVHIPKKMQTPPVLV